MNKTQTFDTQIVADVPLIMKYNLSGEDKKDPYECETDDENEDSENPQSIMMLCLHKVVDQILNNVFNY